MRGNGNALHASGRVHEACCATLHGGVGDVRAALDPLVRRASVAWARRGGAGGASRAARGTCWPCGPGALRCSRMTRAEGEWTRAGDTLTRQGQASLPRKGPQNSGQLVSPTALATRTSMTTARVFIMTACAGENCGSGCALCWAEMRAPAGCEQQTVAELQQAPPLPMCWCALPCANHGPILCWAAIYDPRD